MDVLWKSIMAVLFVLGGVLGVRSLAFGQEAEQEPNNSCETAQDLGEAGLPFAIDATIDGTRDGGDVDFFRFSGPAGALLRIDLVGRNGGPGPLTDPYLGAFDADCNLLTFNDDAGGSTNSTIFIAMPAEGSLTLAATSCCDNQFVGSPGINGTYTLSIDTVVTAAAISGRVVDAANSEPLPGDEPPFAYVNLLRCADGICTEYVNAQPTNAAGEFRFTEDASGNPLTVGTYQVEVFANFYTFMLSEQFEVGEDAVRDLGDLALETIPFAESISGRLVDSVTGAPLPGDAPPFGVAELYRCFEESCVEFVRSLYANSEGRFVFDMLALSYPLPAGTYQVLASAEQYQLVRTEPFTVGEDESMDVGDITLEPFPVQFSEVRPCDDLPPEGGPCNYSVRITNPLTTTLEGAAWSIVGTSDTGTLTNYTVFQTDVPFAANLAPGQSTTVDFNFQVPATVTNGAIICAEVFFGEDAGNPFFNTIGQRNLFCIVKDSRGEFALTTEKETQQLLRAIDDVGRPQTKAPVYP